MIEDIVNNKVCFGCGACEQTCAVKAIEMIPDSEGFLVPEVNEALCIKCGACRKVCQAIHRKDANEVENGVHLIVQNHDYWNTKKKCFRRCVHRNRQLHTETRRCCIRSCNDRRVQG